MTGPANAPVDVIAILADLQQQVFDLTGVLEAQQQTLSELSLIVQSQDQVLRQLLPESQVLPDSPLPAVPGGA